MTWRTVIMVPHEYTVDFARDVQTAQAGAETIRARFDNLTVGEETYYPKIMAVYGPKPIIDAYEEAVKPKPKQLELPLETPPSGPTAA